MAVLALVLASPGVAAAQSTDRAAAAEVGFQEGLRLMAEGKPEEACPKLAASHRLDPSYGAVYNLGRCYEVLGKTASAWGAFREAVDLAQKQQSADRVAKARQHAEALAPKLVKLQVTVSSPPRGLVIQRDDVTLDPALWGSALPVDPGEHRIVAAAPGKQQWRTTITLRDPGKTMEIRVPALADGAPATSPVAASATAPGRASSSVAEAGSGMPAQRIAALGVAAVGVAGLVVGTVAGVEALSRWDQARRDHCDAGHTCDDRGIALHAGAISMAHLSTAGMAVGGGALAAAAILWFTAPATGAARAGRRIELTPLAGAAGGGVVLSGRF